MFPDRRYSQRESRRGASVSSIRQSEIRLRDTLHKIPHRLQSKYRASGDVGRWLLFAIHQCRVGRRFVRDDCRPSVAHRRKRLDQDFPVSPSRTVARSGTRAAVKTLPDHLHNSTRK